MGLFKSLTSIAKNLGSALGTTAVTAGKKAIARAKQATAYDVSTAKPQMPKVHKSSAPKTAKTAKTAITAPKPATVSHVHKSAPKTAKTAYKVAEKATAQTAQTAENAELAKLKAENAQLRDWIQQKKDAEQAEKERVYKNKYEQYGIDDVARNLLNSAGLTIDANSGRIAVSNGRLIMENLGYTPDEISRFFRENPLQADAEDSSSIRQALDAFFGGDAWDGATYEDVSGTF